MEMGSWPVYDFEFEESPSSVACESSSSRATTYYTRKLNDRQLRVFWALGSGIRLNRTARRHLKPQAVFLPAVSTTHSPLLEIDPNLHKSNSTYFTDLDVSRAHLAGLLFGPLSAKDAEGWRCNLVVGAISCAFKREIKPYEAYEAATRVLSWDGKWIYMVTHFVKKGATGRAPGALESGNYKGNVRDLLELSSTVDDAVIASAITQLVFKRRRRTVPPQQAMEDCGLLPVCSSGDQKDAASLAVLDDIEACRKAHLHIAQLNVGWDTIHALFKKGSPVLRRH